MEIEATAFNIGMRGMVAVMVLALVGVVVAVSIIEKILILGSVGT
jgi:hypothetical protein